jgi:hypothetical protein
MLFRWQSQQAKRHADTKGKKSSDDAIRGAVAVLLPVAASIAPHPQVRFH